MRFVKEITKVIDEKEPVRKITLKNPNRFPWYNDDLKKLKHQKHLACKQYRRTHSKALFIILRHRNFFNNLSSFI